MTPEQAQSLLDGTTPVPWAMNPHGNIFASVTGEPVDMEGKYDPGKAMPIIQLHSYLIDEEVTRANQELLTAAPALARTVAGLTEEFQIEFYNGRDWREEIPFENGWNLEQCRSFTMTQTQIPGEAEYRIVRRCVTAPDVITE